MMFGDYAWGLNHLKSSRAGTAREGPEAAASSSEERDNTREVPPVCKSSPT